MIALAIAAVLHNGQTKWFLPNELHVGDTVRCVVGGGHIDAKVKSPSSGYDMVWTKGREVQIARKSNGSTQVTCGTVSPPPFRRPNMPYIIGQNGLALIRGTNTLAVLERKYGKPTGAQPGAGNCVVAWTRLGIQAVFRGNRCTSASVLARVEVSGLRWSALTGAHVGDSVARLVWETPAAKQLSPTQWKIATRLVAVISRGKVAGFVATTRG